MVNGTTVNAFGEHSNHQWTIYAHLSCWHEAPTEPDPADFLVPKYERQTTAQKNQWCEELKADLASHVQYLQLIRPWTQSQESFRHTFWKFCGSLGISVALLRRLRQGKRQMHHSEGDRRLAGFGCNKPTRNVSQSRGSQSRGQRRRPTKCRDGTKFDKPFPLESYRGSQCNSGLPTLVASVCFVIWLEASASMIV